jgi:hypothetical protein
MHMDTALLQNERPTARGTTLGVCMMIVILSHSYNSIILEW